MRIPKQLEPLHDIGLIDEVLRPEDTRVRLIRAFDSLEDKRDSNPPKKHGNIPL